MDVIMPLIPATDPIIPNFLPRQPMLISSNTNIASISRLQHNTNGGISGTTGTSEITATLGVTGPVMEVDSKISDTILTVREKEDTGLLADVVKKTSPKLSPKIDPFSNIGNRNTEKSSSPPLGNVAAPPTFGNKITLQKLLGKGAYGNVYECTDEHGTRMAVKLIEYGSGGIPCLMEASIMATIHHPYLHRSTRIHCAPRTLYIVSELALSDMVKWTRLDKLANIPSLDVLRRWTFSLIQATACLHRQKIIHCDIKASNVLLFSADNNDNNSRDPGVVKLTDFTLATKVFDDSPARRHTICTSTHRPLEVLLNRDWSYPVDIWSLGCTLYEIAYGEVLFPYQGVKSDEGVVLKEKNINCLLDWAARNPHGPQKISVLPSRDEYIPFRLSSRFVDSKYILFNDLILSMLKVNADERPTIFDLLKHSFFSSPETDKNRALIIAPMTVISTPSYQLNEREINKLSRILSKFTSSSTIINMSIDLYSRCLGIRQSSEGPIDENVKLMTCLWIISKMFLRISNGGDTPLYKILAMERIICSHLSFRLLSVPNSEPSFVMEERNEVKPA